MTTHELARWLLWWPEVTALVYGGPDSCDLHEVRSVDWQTECEPGYVGPDYPLPGAVIVP